MKNRNGPDEMLISLITDMEAQIDWLKSCQILCPGSAADGAITRYPNQGWVTPYFANFAAAALLEEPSSLPLVERYLDWYLRNLEKNGTILDYYYDELLQPETATPDSEDAYAGTYLSLAAQYHNKSGNTGWVKRNLPGLKKVARSIIPLMDRDGLTFALAGYRVKYLMDNCEVYRGLDDFTSLLTNLGDGDTLYFRKKTRVMANGIERYLWNLRASCYYPSKTGWLKPRVNLKNFYPDASCQIFPVLYGLIKPDSNRGARLYKSFNANQKDWVSIKPPDYPWMILGYYACLHDDYKRAYDKVRYVREAYISRTSSNWFCAEAAFFVLTCSRLLQNREKWLTQHSMSY